MNPAPGKLLDAAREHVPAMTLEDALACADRLRRIIDEVARHGAPDDLQVPIGELIQGVRSTSANAQRQLRESLAALYPDVGWMGEEDGPSLGRRWLFDPIDGAYHFLQRLPLWSSSLVLLNDERPELAVIYDPTLQETFVALAGHGASVDGKTLTASQKTQVAAAVAGTAVPPIAQVGADAHQQALRLFDRLAREVFVVRPMAAASLQLAYVAAGRLDAYWETGQDIGDWLAGVLMVREAGGIVTDLRGHPFDGHGEGVLAAGSHLHPALAQAATGDERGRL